LSCEEASALESTSETFKVAIIQPAGELAFRDDIGPHHCETVRQASLSRARAFLKLAAEQQAELVLAPEYFTPKDLIEEVAGSPDVLRPGTLYVLPLETIPVADFKQLVALGDNTQIKIESCPLEDKEPTQPVNSVAVLSYCEGQLTLGLQAKLNPAPLEKGILSRGARILAVEGKHLILAVAICSDLNDPGLHYHWNEALKRKGGAILVHTQWNPKPEFLSYEVFWPQLFQDVLGKHRLGFAINWASGSSLKKNGNPFVLPPARNRILRGDDLKANRTVHRALSGFGLTYQSLPLGTGPTTCEVWHCADDSDVAHVMELCRPLVGGPRANAPRDGIRNVASFAWNASGFSRRDATPDQFVAVFWSTLDALRVNQHGTNQLRALGQWDLDQFCQACLRCRKDAWAQIDPEDRPSSSLDCRDKECHKCPFGRTKEVRCARERRNRYEKLELTAECLRSYAAADPQACNGLSPARVDRYPLNLANRRTSERGWLFHGGGRSPRHLEKELGGILHEEGFFDDTRAILRLFAVSPGGEILGHRVSPKEISNVEPERQDILDPEHGPEIIVTTLEVVADEP
jgi:predicted amidohydrolase